jgi:hypothetical protein
MQTAITRQGERDADRPLAGLLLGVTPEIAGLDWPPRSELLAADRSIEMVRLVWPGDVPGRRRAECADWFTLLSHAGPFDVVIGDGSFNTLTFPDGLVAIARLIHRALRADGILVIRLFVEPERRETAAGVFADLQRHAIGSFAVFKFRLAMALQSGSGGGVRLAEVWQVWHDAGIDEAGLRAATGWPLEVIRTIETYRDSPGVLTFPTRRQAEDALGELFAVEWESVPNYEMGDRCPTLVLRSR